MDKLKLILLTSAAIVGNTMLIAIPVSVYGYTMFALICHDWNAGQWSTECRGGFGLWGFMSLVVGGGITGYQFDQHSN